MDRTILSKPPARKVSTVLPAMINKKMASSRRFTLRPSFQNVEVYSIHAVPSVVVNVDSEIFLDLFHGGHAHVKDRHFFQRVYSVLLNGLRTACAIFPVPVQAILLKICTSASVALVMEAAATDENMQFRGIVRALRSMKAEFFAAWK
jgi:hypothetical protein